MSQNIQQWKYSPEIKTLENIQKDWGSQKMLISSLDSNVGFEYFPRFLINIKSWTSIQQFRGDMVSGIIRSEQGKIAEC